MDNLSAGEVGGIFAGIVALLAACGKAIAWAVGWTERRDAHREAKLKAWEDSLNRREVEQRQRTEQRLHAMEAGMAVMRRALITVTSELRAENPASPGLAIAEEALRSAYPIDWETPGDMDGMARGLKLEGEQ